MFRIIWLYVIGLLLGATDAALYTNCTTVAGWLGRLVHFGVPGGKSSKKSGSAIKYKFLSCLCLCLSDK